MTLIAGIKNGNEGCVISDFRLASGFDQTSTVHNDVAEKFDFIDNRLALFISGDVLLLNHLKKALIPELHQITHDNIDDENGPLFKKAKEIFMVRNQRDTSLLGVHLHEETGTFKMFCLRLFLKTGICEINVVCDKDFKCETIGKGAIIHDAKLFPKASPFFLYDVFCCMKNKGFDLFETANACRNEITSKLDSLGSDVYKKYDIGTVFGMGTIKGNMLKIEGMEVEGYTVTSGGIPLPYLYSYGKNSKGKSYLKDNLPGGTTQEVIPLCELHRHNLSQKPETFDPERKEK